MKIGKYPIAVRRWRAAFLFSASTEPFTSSLGPFFATYKNFGIGEPDKLLLFYDLGLCYPYYLRRRSNTHLYLFPAVLAQGAHTALDGNFFYDISRFSCHNKVAHVVIYDEYFIYSGPVLVTCVFTFIAAAAFVEFYFRYVFYICYAEFFKHFR